VCVLLARLPMASSTFSVQASIATETGKEPKPGCLEVKVTRLTWTPDGQASAPVVLSIVDDVKDFFVNKKGPMGKPGRPRLKIELVKRAANAAWIADFGDWADRDAFVERLKDVRAKSGTPGTSAGPSGPQPAVPLPSPMAERAALLSARPDLLQLHTQLVMSKLMTEEDFWRDPKRKQLLHSSTEGSQPTGMRSQHFAADLQKRQASNQVTYTLNKRNVEDIFRAQPLVKKAWMTNVPGKMSDQQFWEAYFKSHHFNRQEKRKDDIFAEAALAEAPTEMAAAAAVTDPSLALHMDDDPREGYGLRDYDAPTQPRGLTKPLTSSSALVIQQFNRHSRTVLQAATGAATSPVPAPHPLPEAGDALSQLVARHAALEDLEDPNRPQPLLLKVADRSRYFEAPNTSSSSSPTAGPSSDFQAAKDRLLQILRGEIEPPPAVKLEDGTPPPILSPPLAVLLARDDARRQARTVLDNMTVPATHNAAAVAQPRAMGSGGSGGDAADLLNAHADKVIEFLRYSWSVLLVPKRPKEDDDRLSHLPESLGILRQELTKTVADLSPSSVPTHGPPLEALQHCIAAAMARAEQEGGCTPLAGSDPKQGGLKRPCPPAEPARPTVSMKMKARRTGVT
jgi:hypothetical protein